MIDSIYADVKYRRLRNVLIYFFIMNFAFGISMKIDFGWRAGIVSIILLESCYLALFYVLYRWRQKEKEKEMERRFTLQTEGQQIVAEISEIEELRFRPNRYYLYYLCTYSPAETNRVLVFKSDSITNYAKSKGKGCYCTVYYDKQNPENYYVDANR